MPVSDTKAKNYSKSHVATCLGRCAKSNGNIVSSQGAEAVPAIKLSINMARVGSTSCRVACRGIIVGPAGYCKLMMQGYMNLVGKKTHG